MVSAVKTRPSYYEVLGNYADGERRRGRGGVREGIVAAPGVRRNAEVSIAYQTLRDPSRRTAYDASLGIENGRRLHRRTRRRREFDTASGGFGIRSLGRNRPPSRAQHRSSPPQLRQPVEPEVARHLTAGFSHAARRSTAEDRSRRSSPPRISKVGRVELELIEDRDRSPIAWRSIGIAGAAIVAVGLLSAWAGSNATDASEPRAARTHGDGHASAADGAADDDRSSANRSGSAA